MKIKDWLFKTKDGDYVYHQTPNVPILFAAFFYFLALITGGDLADIAALVGRTFLVFWSLLEISRGVNNYRRLLGVAVLAFVVINILS